MTNLLEEEKKGRQAYMETTSILIFDLFPKFSLIVCVCVSVAKFEGTLFHASEASMSGAVHWKVRRGDR